MRSSRSAWVFLSVGVLTACAQGGEAPVERAHAAIVDGVASTEPAAVSIFSFLSGGLCTGSLIAPRVVLTAKHCVQQPGADAPDNPQYFSIGVGNDVHQTSATYRAVEARTTPGVYSTGGQFGLEGALVGQDVAVLILSEPVAGVTPFDLRRDTPTDQIGKTLRVIGFGQTPSGQTGKKYETTTSATQILGNVIYTGTSTCQGDSGGPLLQESTGEIIGVTSFGNGACGWGFAGYNLVSPYLDLIDEAVPDSGSCLGSGEEVCDGFDNDCDEEVDEDCLALGETCTTDDQCTGGMCITTTGGKVCSAPCDSLRPLTGCGTGFYCAQVASCTGACLPIGPDQGDAPNDAECQADSECESLHCADRGDGKKRCLTPCKADAGGCYAGEVCVAQPGKCGGCVDASIVNGPRGLGEPCEADSECRSSSCVLDDPSPYCTRDCDDDSECGAGFHCRLSECVRGARGGVGTVCAAPSDCQELAVCAVRDTDQWCTVTCESDENCPERFSCVDTGSTSVCAPEVGLLGDGCATDAECASGTCKTTTAGRRCTRTCDPTLPCDTGFECSRTSDGLSAYCVPSGEGLSNGRSGGGGCSVSSAGRAAGATDALSGANRGGIFVALALGCAWARRRRRPRA